MKAAEIIKEQMHEKGITITRVSGKTGIPVNQISQSLLGKRKLGADEMIRICACIGLDVGAFNNASKE